MHQFTCHVTAYNDVTRRVDVEAIDIAEARRKALASVPRSLRATCRAKAPVAVADRRSGGLS